MAITVYFSYDSKRRNSTKQLQMPDHYDCVYKNGCSMLNPTLLLELPINVFPACTAFKIEDRYYNVTDIQSVRNNLFEITGEIDVLATYKSAILASTQFVSYSSHNSSIWLPDTRIPLLKSGQVSAATTTMNFLFTDVGFYVLSTIGKNGADIWCADKIKIRDLLNKITDWSDDLIDDVLNADYPWSQSQSVVYDFSTVESAIESMSLMSMLTGFAGNAYADAPNCLRSCIWVPFLATWFVDGSDEIYLGQFPTGVTAPHCSAEPASRSVTVSIPWHYSDWRRATCEEVYLYLPLVGLVNIPSDEIVSESSITVTWSATATDGCIAYLVKAGSQVVGTFGANASANFPIGVSQQSSAGEQAQAIGNAVSKTVSNGIETAKAVSGGNAFDIASSAANTAFGAISGAYNVVDTMLTRHNSYIGGIGGGAGVGLSKDLTCFTVAHPTVMQPADMKDTMGLPTMIPMSLASLTGYCQCANAHLDISATATEKTLIDNYLNSGFFIE